MSTVFVQRVSDLVERAVAAARGGRMDEGERLLAAARNLAPADAEALRWSGALALQRGDPARASEYLERLVASVPADADALRDLGRARRALGDLPGAIETYRRAIAADPAHAEVRVSLGIALKQSGDLAGAAQAFRDALERDPRLAEAHHSLALLLRDEGRNEEAIQSWQRAVAQRPGLGPAWLGLAMLLRAAGRAGEARDAYRQAVRCDPSRALTHLELGVLEREMGTPSQALPHFEAAARLDPQSVDARHNLGTVLFELERYAEACPHFEAAAALAPVAEQYTRLGEALRHAGRHAEAAAAYERSLALEPGRARVHLALGTSLQMLNRWDESEAAYRRALALGGEDEAARTNLGALYLDQGRHAQSLEQLQLALAINPQAAEVHSNVGVALYMSQRPREALQALERAMTLAPELPQSNLWAGMTRLMLGEFDEGWRRFEWRWRAHDGMSKSELRFDRPRWCGESLRGKTILLTAEQGLGDTLQFVRYAPLLAADGARVRLLVPKPLVRLLSRVEGVERVFGPDEAPEGFDVHCPLMSVPLNAGTRLDNVPANVPYLPVDAGEVREWARRLEAAGVRQQGLKVGLVWSGDPRPGDRGANLTDARRSVTLEQYAPLARVPGVQWVSLQKGAPAQQASAPPAGMRLVDVMDDARDFADTAALVANLDLVVTVDTSMVHLVGGIGKPAWMLSRYDGCWRWMLGRDDSPWYPGLRLYRQDVPLEWTPVVERIAGDLAALAGNA